VGWETVLATRPEVIVIMPCGYRLAAAEAEFRNLPLPNGWNDLPAVRDGRIFIVEAAGYFSRPGPRLAAGMRVLAGAIHAKKQEHFQPFESSEFITRVAAAGHR
jgi:iron complex transport system substrate-binding protein